MILDADPLADIRNTGRIHAIVKGGEIVDRAAIRALAVGERSEPSPVQSTSRSDE